MLKEKARQTWAATLFGFVRGGGGREGQRSPLCTLSAAGKDTWVETRGRREDNDSYDGMTSVDAAQGDDGEYGGDTGDRGGSHDRMGRVHGGRRYLEKAGH